MNVAPSQAVNIAARLPEMARDRPQTLAIVEPAGRDRSGRIAYRHLTFGELDADSDAIARGLQEAGITRGTRTALMVRPGLDFYALTFSLFKIGAVVVLIDPGIGVGNLGVCLGEAEPEAFIGIPKAHVARILLRWARGSVRTSVTVGKRFGWGGRTLDEVRKRGYRGSGAALAQTRADETAAILFTSGSTGVAKGAVYTHGIFAAQVEMLRQRYGIEPGEVDLPTFPLFGLFGPALGMTEVIPDMDPTRPARVDPTRILAAVRQFGVTNLFGSPALIRRVGEYGSERGEQLPTLRRVISAGAPVPARAIERFGRMLGSGVQIHTPYGATESLPVASIGSDEILGETARRTDEGAGVCVGRPVPGMQVRIIRISDETIPEWREDLEVPAGEVGELAVRGPVVTRSYYNRPRATELAKIVDPAGGFYHRMGDVGYFDEAGRIWFCGRKSQRVVASRGTLFTIPCEGVFNAQPGVARTALVGVNLGGATEPVLCVEREKGSFLSEEKVREGLLARGASHAHTQGIRHVLFHEGFPVDVRHNAKIFREKLAVWAASRLGGQKR